MNTLLYAALGTGFTFLMTALGAAAVFFVKGRRRKGALRLCLGFAAGVMLAATVWSLLLPALETAEGAWLPAVGGLVAGVLFLLVLEGVMTRLPASLHRASRSTGLLFAAVTLHNIPEGMAVGLSFALAAQSGSPAALLGACSLALGIGVQNLPEGTALALPLHQDGLPRGKAFLLGAGSAVVEPVFGIAAVLLSTQLQPLMPYLLSFAAGAMLIVCVRELIPQSCGGDADCAGELSVMAGFILMMILDIALGV